MSVQNISAKDFQGFESVILIDVREDGEFAMGSVPGAIHYPLSGFNVERIMTQLDLTLGESEIPVVFICRSGRRSMEAARKFHFFGFSNVYNLEGGILSWQQSGFPVREVHDRISTGSD